jgi:hypothetical protein
MKRIVKQKQCGMEQLAARRAHNPKVAGSSPAPAIKQRKSLGSKDLRLLLFKTIGSSLKFILSILL